MASASHGSGGRLEIDLVGVLLAVVEVTLLAELADAEEECGAAQDSVEEGVRDSVVHLVVKSVELLETGHLVQLAWGVSDVPHAQLHHVSEHGVGVGEWDLLSTGFLGLDVGILVLNLAVVATSSHMVTESLFGRLENSELVSHFNYLLQINYNSFSI